MERSIEFVKSFRFSVIVDGRMIGVALVSDVDRVFGPNGRGYTKPVTIEAAPMAGTKGLAGEMGERTRQRKNIRLVEISEDGSPARTIHLDGCKIRGAVTNAHDARFSDVVIDRVKLHPTKIRYEAGGSLPVNPRPVFPVTPGMP